MGLVAEVRRAALARPVGIAIELAAASRAVGGRRWRLGLRRNQRGVDHRALLEHQAASLELTVQLLQQPIAKASADQGLPEAAQGRLVRGRLIQSKAAEAA